MWLFVIFYGFTFAIGTESQGNDIVAYVSQVKDFYYLQLSFSDVINLYKNSGEIDILRIFLAWLIATFTSNGYFLIIIYGILFGYFYSRNIWYVLERLQGKTQVFSTILIFCFFLAIPIWNLNGFRFWTAAHVFIYGLLPYIFEGKRRPLLWCFFTPIIFHFSFLAALIPLITYLIIGDRIKMYFILFIASFFFSEFNITSFNNFVESNVPQVIVERTKGYRHEDNVEKLRAGETNSNMVWYARYYTKALRWTIVFLLTIIYLKLKQILIQNQQYLRLLSFIFLFFSFANILSTIPSGGRFIVIGNMIALAFMTMLFHNNRKKSQVLIFSHAFSTPLLLFFIVISLRVGLYSFSAMTVLGNPLGALFSFGENISLNDIIKGL